MENCQTVIPMIYHETHERGNLVELSKLDDHFIIELRYARPDNFTGQRVYSSDVCLIDAHTAERLIDARKLAEAAGCGMKVWDAYRPVSAQRRFWEICSDTRFVAKPPREGDRIDCHAGHMNGMAVDVTLTDRTGQEIPMPTAFDDFSEAAALEGEGHTGPAYENARLLRSIMEKAGFMGDPDEWWHFSDVTQEPVMYFDYIADAHT